MPDQLPDLSNPTSPQPAPTQTVLQPAPQPTPAPNVPQQPQPKSGINVLLIGVIVVLVLILAAAGGFYALNSNKDKVGNNSTNTAKDSSNKTTDSTTESKTSTSTQTAPDSQYIFDVPFFLNKSRDEVKAILGKPVNEYTDPDYHNIGYVQYSKDNYTFQSEYVLTKDGKSSEFGYLAVSVGYKRDKATLYKELNLSENNKNYKIGTKSLSTDKDYITSIYVFPKDSKYYDPTEFEN